MICFSFSLTMLNSVYWVHTHYFCSHSNVLIDVLVNTLICQTEKKIVIFSLSLSHIVYAAVFQFLFSVC